MPRPSLRILPLLLTVPLGLAACGTSDDSSENAEAPAIQTMPGRQPDCVAPGFALTEVDSLPNGLAAAVPTPQGWEISTPSEEDAEAQGTVFHMEKLSDVGVVSSVTLTAAEGSDDADGDIESAVAALQAQADPDSFYQEDPSSTCGYPSQYAEYTAAEGANEGDGVVALVVSVASESGNVTLTLTGEAREQANPDDEAELQAILAGLQVSGS